MAENNNENYMQDPYSIITLDLMNDAERDKMAKLCNALGNPVRLEIMRYLQRAPRVFSVPSLVKALKIPTTTLLFHLEKMQEVGLLHIIYKSSGHGAQRFVARKLHGADLRFYSTKQLEQTVSRAETYALGVGRFYDFVGETFSFCTEKTGYISHGNTFCYVPERFDAQLVFTPKGRITYRFGNLPAKQYRVRELALSLEICSEAPYFDNHYQSDITFWINGKEIMTYTCPGDFGDRRGRLNPEWWSSVNTQYGQLLTVSITDGGVTINGSRASSSVKLEDLELGKNNFTEVTFGNKDTALNPGGFNIFGKLFGDHPQDICLTYYYNA